MGAIAHLLLAKDARVSGSDINDNKMVKSLKAKGAEVFIGHDAKHLKNVDCVVYSSAVKSDNPELKWAIDKGLKIYQRAELLAELMQNHFAITVAGAHGKTTTTSMAAHLLKSCGVNPTCAVGGLPSSADANAYLGGGKYFVAEVDESDGSFLNFTPKISIITNIDLEHLDHYAGWENIEAIYKNFILRTESNGHILFCGDDQRLKRLVCENYSVYQSYGLGEENDLRAVNIKQNGFDMVFDCVYRGEKIGSIALPVPGEHNVLNALACVLLGLTLYMSFEDIKSALEQFSGVQRRFQKKAQVNDILVIDDYAHHPTEIEMTVEAARQLDAKRVVAIFQPHRYTRLAGLWEEFCDSLAGIDHLIVTDVYAAGEEPVAGASIEKFIKKLKEKNLSSVEYKAKDGIVEHVLAISVPGDVILTLGAGDITQVAGALAESLDKTFDTSRCVEE